MVVSLLLAAGSVFSPVSADDGKTVDGVYFRAKVRTPDQMAAFYEARGFPAGALKQLNKYCFITVIVRNRSNRVVWLEPSRWRARSGSGTLMHPMSPSDWRKQWDAVSLPAAQRSTFQWTQLPESRDLRPHEPVGGNLAFPGIKGKFRLELRLDTGADRHGPPIRTYFDGLNCSPGVSGRK